MKSPLGLYLEGLLKKRNFDNKKSKYQIDEQTIQQLTTSPEKIDGKLFGYFLQAIEISPDEYAELSLIALRMSEEQTYTKDQKNRSSSYSKASNNKLSSIQLPVETSLERKKELLLDVFSKHLEKDQVLENFYHEHLFTYHVELVTQWCQYVEEEFGVKMEPLLESEKLDLHKKYYSLDLRKRHLKLQRFLGYFRHILSLKKHKIHFSDRRSCLEHYLKFFGWYIPDSPSVLKLIEGQDVFVEIFDGDYIQMYRSLDFCNVTNHSLMKLETYEWWEIFKRQPKFTDQATKVIASILSGEIKKPVFNPVEKNIIEEINFYSPKKAEIEALVYGPIFNQENTLSAGLHIFRYKDVT